jgi:glucose-6-phosphate 1-dehydrogenase
LALPLPARNRTGPSSRDYEQAGALRDMVQNHLFQLLALTAMEPPIAFDPDAVRDERVKVLNAIHPLSAADVARDAVRAQYGSAADGSGQAYRAESGVDPDSSTETRAMKRCSMTR